MGKPPWLSRLANRRLGIPSPSPGSGDTWAAVTGIAAVATVIVATIGLYFAWKATKAAKDTVEIADKARRADEHDRLVRRLERVGELVEEVHHQALVGSPDYWQKHRNRLRQAVVGLRDQLPLTVQLVDTAITVDQARADAAGARQEIDTELEKLAKIPELAPERRHSWWRRSA